MKDTVAVIMGGGQGSRLFPLTRDRAKPAVPLFGRIRLIDVPLSNCIHSGITRMFVLTQFNSASLNRHIYNTYRFSTLFDDGVDILAAEQTPERSDWFQGTADAVRQSLHHVLNRRTRHVLILAGDHLYRMNYGAFIECHEENQADITIAVCPVAREFASSFGLMKVDDGGRVVEFAEKPVGEALDAMRVPAGAPVLAGTDVPFLASMGIYVFSPRVLQDVLARHGEANDFGKEVIPAALDEYRVIAYPFHGYWEDIGTISAFYRANLAATRRDADRFTLHDPEFPLFTHPRYLSPTRLDACEITRSLVAEGGLIGRARVDGSVIGIRARILDGVEIRDTLVMGADSYETDTDRSASLARGVPPMGIGPGSVVRGAILDKDVRIGEGVRLVNEAGVEHADGDQHFIRDGVVIVPKGAVIPDGTVV